MNPTDQTKEPTLDESIAEIVPQLPQPIQDFFTAGKVEDATKKIVAKYQLHVDQGAVVEREIIMLLLGINSADVVSKALAEDAQITGAMLGAVIDDLNALVFSPIRNALRAPQPIAPKPAPAIPAPLINLPGAPLQQLLEDHEEPHINLRATPTPLAPIPAPKPTIQSPAPLPPKPIIKEYAADPYREPLEEK